MTMMSHLNMVIKWSEYASSQRRDRKKDPFRWSSLKAECTVMPPISSAAAAELAHTITLKPLDCQC